MKLEEYLKVIEKFVSDYLVSSKMDRYVLGLSGGVDSSLVAAICKHAVGKDKLTCIAMPIDSIPEDLNDAKEVARQLDVNLIVIDGSEIFHAAKKEFENIGEELDTSTLSNFKVRIRMSILYAYAQKYRGLVIGTDNADEKYTGYFTKYGDGGVDLLPIAHLLKREVMEACRLYGLEDRLAFRTPSAGLFHGQTDEADLGVTYEELDNYLLGKKIATKSQERIEYLHRISEHKRAPIPMPEGFKRDEE